MPVINSSLTGTAPVNKAYMDYKAAEHICQLYFRGILCFEPNIDQNIEPNIELNSEPNIAPNIQPNIELNIELNSEPNIRPNIEQKNRPLPPNK